MEKPSSGAGQNLHVLMVSLPYQGHINPMLRFAKILTSKGLEVTLATTEVARSRLRTSGGTPNPSNDPGRSSSSSKQESAAHDVELEFFEDGLSADMDRDKNLGALLEEYLPREGARNLSSLIRELGNKKGKVFSCVVASCFVPWVADVAAEHGVHCSMLWIQASALYAIYYRYHKGVNEFPLLDEASNVVELPGLPLLRVEDLPTFILPSGPRHFYNVMASCMESLDKIRWVFGSSFQSLEQDVVQSMATLKPIHPIGPLVPPFLLGNIPEDDSTSTQSTTAHLWDAEDTCIEWLGTQPPSSVLYISLGSISVLTQSETEAVAMALESTGIRFLWVMKKGSDGWERTSGELPEGFVERTKERGKIVSWCPQDRVLMHGALACFLTHCGWNSTLEAVAAGVPVIAYPDWTDQTTNAKLLVDVFGMGVRMRRNEIAGSRVLRKEEVERCILEVTNGTKGVEIKEKAGMWKRAANEAVAVGGSSHAVIESFIQEMLMERQEDWKDVN